MRGVAGSENDVRRRASTSLPTHTSGGVSRAVVLLAVVGTILLALGAFWLSFTTLRDLAVLSGIPEGQAWVWPLIVDGVILEATISVVALRNSARPARRFAWVLLAAGAGVSVAANVTHAVVAADARVPALVAALVASVPPMVLLAMTHLTVELTRNTAPISAPELDTPAPELEVTAEIEGTQQARALTAEDATAPVSGMSEAPSLPAQRVARVLSREEERRRARELYAGGMSMRQIAAERGVHPTTVSRWVHAPEGQQDGDPHD